MSDKNIEMEIQTKGLNAPRITPSRIEDVISSEHYFTANDGANFAFIDSSTKPNVKIPEWPDSLHLLTFCVLVLKNGFTVTGESACASPQNFDPEIGKKIARENAINKIWPLEGYLLKQKLSEQ